jgi:CTP:molybdopterin cytidylyltransferase MocA
MGQPKPLLHWGDTTLLAWEIEELLGSVVDDIAVVTGAQADDVRRSLGRAARHCVFNARWAQGRAGSLACGARALAAPGRALPEAVVVLNVDQPTRAAIVDRLVSELRSGGHEVVQPSYEGTAGHPVVLRGDLLPELTAVTEETLGLRGVIERHTPAPVAMDDEPLVRIDLDTPDTLEEARRLLGVG